MGLGVPGRVGGMGCWGEGTKCLGMARWRQMSGECICMQEYGMEGVCVRCHGRRVFYLILYAGLKKIGAF